MTTRSKIAEWAPLLSIIGVLTASVGATLFLFCWFTPWWDHPVARLPLFACWLLVSGDVLKNIADDMRRKKWPWKEPESHDVRGDNSPNPYQSPSGF